MSGLAHHIEAANGQSGSGLYHAPIYQNGKHG